MELRPPMEPALVRPAARRPRFATTHDIAFEPKWDGFRCIAFRGDGAVDLQTRRGRMLTGSFADVTAALGVQLEPGTVLDGELVVWDGARLHYGALQARLSEPVWPRRPGRHAPAGYVVFDLLADGGHDLRARRPGRPRGGGDDGVDRNRAGRRGAGGRGPARPLGVGGGTGLAGSAGMPAPAAGDDPAGRPFGPPGRRRSRRRSVSTRTRRPTRTNASSTPRSRR